MFFNKESIIQSAKQELLNDLRQKAIKFSNAFIDDMCGSNEAMYMYGVSDLLLELGLITINERATYKDIAAKKQKEIIDKQREEHRKQAELRKAEKAAAKLINQQN